MAIQKSGCGSPHPKHLYLQQPKTGDSPVNTYHNHTIKMTELLTNATTETKLRGTVLRKSQIQKTIYCTICIIPFFWHFRKGKTSETQKRSVFPRDQGKGKKSYKEAEQLWGVNRMFYIFTYVTAVYFTRIIYIVSKLYLNFFKYTHKK